MASKNSIYLNIAGFNIKLIFRKTEPVFSIDKFQSEMLQFNEGFISRKKPGSIDFQLVFCPKKTIIFTKSNNHTLIYLYEEKSDREIITYYHISRSLFIILLRYILDNLLGRDGLLLHCSASEINGKAIIFTGEQGSGKSTAAGLIEKIYPILADDIGIIKQEDKVYYFYQTPILGKRKDIRKSPKGYPIEKIFFLHKAKYFKKERIRQNSILARVANQTWIEKKDNVGGKYNFLLNLASNFKDFYMLSFPKDSPGLINFLSD